MARNVLWLGDSSDRNPRVIEEQRIPTIVTSHLAADTGQEFTPVVRVLWPAPNLVNLVEGWIERFEPAAVVLHVNPFWFTYESVPERVRRILGPLGAPVASVGLRAAGTAVFSENPVFKMGRRAVVGIVGGDVVLPARESAVLLGEIIRTVVATEDIVMLVRGPLGAPNAAGTKRSLAKAVQRRAFVHRVTRVFCAKLHVAYIGTDLPPVELQTHSAMMGDEVHMSADYQALQATLEGDALIAAWRDAHGG